MAVVKRIAFVLLLLVAVQADTETFSARGLTQARAEGSSNASVDSKRAKKAAAVATATAFSTGGTVKVHVKATSEAVSDVSKGFAEAVSSSVAKIEEGGDPVALAKADATAYAEGVAEAYAAVSVDISSTSAGGSGCGSGFSNAEATALAFARAFVEVLAEASDYINFSSSKGSAEAISVATAHAYAEAQSSACLRGKGSAKAIQETLSIAIVRPYASVLAKAYAAVSEKDAESEIVVEGTSGVDEEVSVITKGKAEIDGDGFAEVDGQGKAVTTPIEEECGFDFGNCCRRRRRGPRQSCRCGFRCRAELVSADGEGPTVYEVTRVHHRFANYKVGHKCFCPL